MPDETKQSQEKWSEDAILDDQSSLCKAAQEYGDKYNTTEAIVGLLKVRSDLSTLRAENERLKGALLQLLECNLNNSNCASFDVANKRIRNIANKALLSELNKKKEK